MKKSCVICKTIMIYWHCPYCNKEYWVCPHCGSIDKVENQKKEKKHEK